MSVSTLLLVAANLLPLAGVAFWGWDVFVLLILYWMETLVIAFWTIARLATLSTDVSDSLKIKSDGNIMGRFAMAAFFTVHAGIFMLVHFIFLWALFSGAWAERVHSVAEFWSELVIGTDMWAPLLFLFVVRGWQVFGLGIRRRLGLVPADARETVGPSILSGLYIRIFVMQVTIIFGGWLAMTLGGSVGVLALLVVAKTIGEVFFDPMARKADAARAMSAP